MSISRVYNSITMRSNTLDYTTLRAVATEASENGLMVCLSAKTLTSLIDKAEQAELTSVLPTLQLMNPPMNKVEG